jgi:putative membrane protein
MSGLLLLTMMRYVPLNPVPSNHPRIRVLATGVTAVIWLISTVLLVLSLVDPAYKPFTYLTLELSWALVPIIIQLAFGADILWRHRAVVLPGILIPTIYLSLADTVAIDGGTWTIDPAQSVGILLGGILPIEELIFFLLTNTLVVLGLTLVLAEESQVRAMALQRIGAFRSLLKLAQRTDNNHDAV